MPRVPINNCMLMALRPYVAESWAGDDATPDSMSDLLISENAVSEGVAPSDDVKMFWLWVEDIARDMPDSTGWKRLYVDCGLATASATPVPITDIWFEYEGVNYVRSNVA